MQIKGKTPRWLTLCLLMVIGIALIFIPHLWEWKWDHGSVSDVGVAVVILSGLGLTIDRWFKADLAKDVFEAAVGHILRDELRDEIHWIAGFKLLCVRCRCHLKIEDMGNDIVRITTTTEREIENISSHSENISNGFATDDWGFSGYRSEILRCAIQKPGEQAKEHTGIKSTPSGLSAETEKFSVAPKETITLFAKATEYRRANDHSVLVFMVPTTNPELEIEISDTLEYDAGFSHRGGVVKDTFMPRRTLKGTFLPHQHLGARWWPKTQPAS